MNDPIENRLKLLEKRVPWLEERISLLEDRVHQLEMQRLKERIDQLSTPITPDTTV